MSQNTPRLDRRSTQPSRTPGRGTSVAGGAAAATPLPLALLLVAASLPLSCGILDDETAAETPTASETAEPAAPEPASPDSQSLVDDALASDGADDPLVPDDVESERDRLAAERAALEERERQLAEREAQLAAEREAREAAARELREREVAAAQRAQRQAEQERLRREAQQAELERARRAQSESGTSTATPNGSVAATPADEPRTEQAVLVDRDRTAEDVAASDPIPAPSETAEWTGDEDWRSGRGGAADLPPVAEDRRESRPTVDASEAAQRLRPGQRFTIELTETVSSADRQVGDTFSTRLASDVVDGSGAVIVPAGTELRGTVTEVKPLRKVGGRATLGIVVDRIVLDSGDEIEIRASLREFGADKRGDKFRIAGAAVAGAILGSIFGDTEGAIAGAAAGAAASTAAVVARSRGEDVELPEGTEIELELDEIVTVHEEIGGVVRR